MLRKKNWVLMIYETNHIWNAKMKWKWTQFMQLRKEDWKKKFRTSRVWTRDLAITGAMLYQLSYEATDVGSRSIVGEHMNPQLTCSQRQWLHSSVGRASHRPVIARSRVQTPLKSWILFFQASLRNCINCVHCDEKNTVSKIKENETEK